MKASGDSDTTIEFIGQHTAHLFFKGTGTIGTHLLRELIVASRVQFGEDPKALIFSIQQGFDSAHFFRKIRNRSRQIAPETLIALVCLSRSTFAEAKAFFEENKPDHPIAIFSDFRHGVDWIDCKLTGTETIELISTETPLIGMTA